MTIDRRPMFYTWDEDSRYVIYETHGKGRVRMDIVGVAAAAFLFLTSLLSGSVILLGISCFIMYKSCKYYNAGCNCISEDCFCKSKVGKRKCKYCYFFEINFFIL